MSKEKIKVYLYTRVSTSIQIEGYSLEAQKSRMKAFAIYNDYEIVGEYEDAGKSGRSIEGRIQFNRMMEDIKSGKDGVSFVLVFKLARFARNAADVLSTLQIMQDYGVNLICVDDGIDSSKDAGKLMISVLSAVAEIERENIRIQTMEGRIQKAREGKWNGGFAPYGYKLEDGELFINEEEAVAIRTIFDQYVNTTIGANGLSKYLENHGIRKIPRQNGKNPLFDAGLIRKILKNPVYNGKIAFGRRTLEKVHGTRNEYKQVEQDEYLISEGIHEAIVSDEVWQAAQVKLKSQAKKYEHVNKGKDTRTHMLSGIVKCPICGVGMFGNKCIKKKKDGTKYKDFYYYGCKHRQMIRGHKCTFSKQIREELLDDAVAEVIVKIVSNPKFASMMQEKINMKVDTSEIEKEIDNYQKELRKSHSTKFKLIEEIDNLDVDDKHYKRRKQDLDDRLYRMYDKIEELESLLIDAKAKKQTIEAEKLTGDNIYKVLIYFDKLYKVMNDVERRQLITALISEIQVYEEKQPNGQWLKSITFKLPIIDDDLNISLDNNEQVESKTVIELFQTLTQDEEWKLLRELNLLNLDKNLIYREFSTLSKGEQTKILLAILFTKEDVFLLIDEPTNHLDMDGRKLVSEYLKSKKGFLLISHDRDFLDGCVNHIISINRNSIDVQSGNFTSWYENKMMKERFEISKNERLRKDIKRLKESARQSQTWSDKIENTKNGIKVSGVKPDKGHIGHKSAKMMQKSKNLRNRLDKAIEEKETLLKDVESKEDLSLHSLRHHKENLLTVNDLSSYYGDKQVLNNISFEIKQGDIVAIYGSNGSGKSTLIKIILGYNQDFTKYSGEIKLANNLKISYIPQDIGDLKGSLNEHIYGQNIDEALCKTILRKLNFSRDLFNVYMKDYSDW